MKEAAAKMKEAAAKKGGGTQVNSAQFGGGQVNGAQSGGAQVNGAQLCGYQVNGAQFAFAADAASKESQAANTGSSNQVAVPLVQAVVPKSKWGPPLALVGSMIEVEWNSGWCEVDIISEERQANGRQLFKFFYTDPAEPIESRFQINRFDIGKQYMEWRPVVVPKQSQPPISLSGRR